MNISAGEKLFQAFEERMLKELADHLENKAYEILFTANMMKHSDFTVYLQAYVQLPLSVLYLVFALFLLYVFLKENIVGFVQCILILSNIIVIIQMVVTAPFLLVFFGIGDHSVPIPYPWCTTLIFLEAHIKSITRITSLYLKLLLAINRVCSLYYPFKMRIWFTKKKCAIYCFAVIAACVTAGVLTNFTYERFTYKPYFGELWGRFQTYTACSLAPSEYKNYMDSNFILHGGELFLTIAGIICIGVCNALVFKRIMKTKSQRLALAIVQSTYTKDVENRMSLLNRISLWVLVTCLVCEIPFLISNIFNLYDYIVIIREAGGDNLRPYVDGLVVIQYVLLTPLDLVIFVAMSKKTRDAMKKRLCAWKYSN